MGCLTSKSKNRKTTTSIDKNIFKSQFDSIKIDDKTDLNLISHGTASTENIYYFYDVGKITLDLFLDDF